MLASFVNLAEVRVIWEEKTIIDKMLLADWLVGKSVLPFLDWWLTWEDPTHCQRTGDIELYKKANWGTHGSKQVSISPPGLCSSSCLQVSARLEFLSWLSLLEGSYVDIKDEISLLFPELLLSWHFTTPIGTLSKIINTGKEVGKHRDIEDSVLTNNWEIVWLENRD